MTGGAIPANERRPKATARERAAATQAESVAGGSALTDPEASQVLSYWLSCLRHAEALGDRPRARRRRPGQDEEAPVNLAAPAPGQSYAKLPIEGCERFLAERRGHAEIALDAEGRAFFEDWLDGRYRRGDDDDARVGHLACFPSVLSSRDELTGLLRAPVQATWLTESGKPFSPPSQRERARGALPEAPTSLRLSSTESDGEGALPFFVDTRLLRETLRVDVESVDAFFSKLRQSDNPRALDLLEALCELLESQTRRDSGGPEPAEAPPPKTAAPRPPPSERSRQALDRLHRAVDSRLKQLGARSRCFPVALILNADRSRATAHVQRDIQAALELLESKGLRGGRPLSRYLRGEPLPEPPVPGVFVLGRFSKGAMTTSQRRAAERALGSRLCSVQGPPGTGKTRLILDLVAHTLVQKMLPLLDGHSVDRRTLVVTSTNNAAVDQVLDPLGAPERPLPLGLRVGSREVTEKATVTALSRTRDFLSEHRDHDYEGALSRFRERHQALSAALQAVGGEPGANESGGAESATSEASRARADVERESSRLFEAARELRRHWAVKQRITLLEVLPRAVDAARGSRSLRRFLETRAGVWLERLFPAWGCTLLSLGNAFPAELDACDRIVIDEAGQCHPAYAVSALLRAKSALVIGDVHQLEPVVGLSRDDEARILRGIRPRLSEALLEPYRAHDESGSSAQSLADRAVTTRPTLVDHFRCQPEIAAICERLCGYGLVAHTPRASRADLLPELGHPVLFEPLGGLQERHAGSWMNAAEARAVVDWVQRLLTAGLPGEDLGVITPFRGQLEVLFRALRAAGVPLEDRNRRPDANLDLFASRSRPDAGVAVGTVHRFQGGERSVILFSTAVTRTTSLRFLDERENLVNVAASRARHHLLTLGHEATLRAGRHTAALLDGALRLETVEPSDDHRLAGSSEPF